jgi:hypothetical protein
MNSNSTANYRKWPQNVKNAAASEPNLRRYDDFGAGSSGQLFFSEASTILKMAAKKNTDFDATLWHVRFCLQLFDGESLSARVIVRYAVL